MNKLTKSSWSCTIFRCFLLQKSLKCPSRYVSKIIKMWINLFQLSLLNGGEWTAFSLINICNIYRFFLSRLFLFILFHFFLRLRLGSLIFVNNFYLQFYFLSLDSSCFYSISTCWSMKLFSFFYDLRKARNWIIFKNVFLSQNLRNILAKWIYFICMKLHHDSKAQTFISIIFHQPKCLRMNICLAGFFRKTLLGFDFILNLFFWWK